MQVQLCEPEMTTFRMGFQLADNLIFRPSLPFLEISEAHCSHPQDSFRQTGIVDFSVPK